MKYLLPIIAFLGISFLFTTPSFAARLVKLNIPSVEFATPEIPAIPDLPEVSGDYPVPEKPNLRLRVIAHPKPNHRNPVPTTQNLCTSDNESSANPTLAGWHIKGATMTYRVNYSTVPSSVGAANAEVAIANSFETWNGQISSVDFVEGSQTSVSRSRYDGQNAVMWRRLSSSGTLAVAYMWYYPSTGELAEADLLYNTRVRWSYTPSSAQMCSGLGSYDVQNVGTHEVGHWTGLDDMYSSAFVDNTMYGYADVGELKKDTLTNGDKQSVQNLYP